MDPTSPSALPLPLRRRTLLRHGLWAGACGGAVGSVGLLGACATVAPARPEATAPPPTTTTGAAATSRPPLIERLQALGLQVTPGRLALHHGAAQAARASALHTLLAEALDWTESTLGVGGAFTLAVLDAAQWRALGVDQPYGIPGVAGAGAPGAPPVVFMPADDHGLAAQDALSLAPRVAPATLQRLRDAGHTWEDAAARHVDLIGLHELGHVFTRRYGIAPPNLWLDELLATAFAHAFMAGARPALLPLWSGAMQGYLDAVQPAHRTLQDFERLYFRVGSFNYVWYQAQFQQRVATLHAAQGLAALAALRDAFPPPPPPVRPDPDTLLARLETLAPGWQAWARAMQASAGTG